MDISTIIFIALCCILPYLAPIALFAIIGTWAKYKSAINALSNIEQNSPGVSSRLSSSKLVKTYILIVFAFLAILIGGLTIVVLYFLNSSTVLNLDEISLGIILLFFLMGGVIMSIALVIIFMKLYRR